MNGAVICLDIGTSHIKLSLFTAEGILCYRSQEETPYAAGLPPFMTELEPDRVEQAVRRLLDRVRQETSLPVEAITVTGMAKSELPVSKDGRPLYHAISWMDNRCADISFPDLAPVSGMLQHDPITTTYLPYRIKWMRQHHPELCSKADCWVNITDYIQSRLVNHSRSQTDYSEACRSLLYDSLNERWNGTLAEFFEVDPAKLPEVKEAGTVLGLLDSSYGLGSGVRVVVGAHDHMSASKAACLHQEGVPLLSTGTSEMMIVSFGNDRPVRPQGYNIDHQADRRRWALVSCIARSGDSMNWANRLFGLYQMEKRPDFIPCYYQNYNRLPIYLPAAVASNPSNSGSFSRLTNRHEAIDLSLSVLEGLCLESMIVSQQMSETTGRNFEMYRLVGGFAAIPALLKFKSAALGVPLAVFPKVDMSSLGGYLLCRKALCPFEDADAVAMEILGRQEQNVIQPEPKLSELLHARLAYYKAAREIMLNNKEIS